MAKHDDGARDGAGPRGRRARRPRRVRVVLADDHDVVREGLTVLLDAADGIEVVGEAADGLEAVAVTVRQHPEVVVMDLSLPRLNGFEAIRRIRSEAPAVRVLALSGHTDHTHVTEAFRAGAVGYVVKDSGTDELIAAIRAVDAGRSFLSPQVAGTVIEDLVGRLDGPSAFTVLTEREREVVQGCAEGLSTREVAALLGVSPKTVETHRANAMHKLHIDSLAQLVKYAIREGLTTLDR